MSIAVATSFPELSAAFNMPCMARTANSSGEKKQKTVSARISSELLAKLRAIAAIDAQHSVSKVKPTDSQMIAAAVEAFVATFDAHKGRKHK